MIVLNPYLNFQDKAEEAMNFYKDIFGGELEITRFADFPAAPVDDKYKNLVMHSVLKTDKFQLMAADSAPNGGVRPGSSISLSLSGGVDDEATLEQYYDGLSDGANILQPLEKAQWGDTFGMLTDKYGTTWFINIAGQK